MFIKILLSTHLLLAAQTLIQNTETYYQLMSWFSTIVTESISIDHKILANEDKMEFVESQSQRMNIRVNGIPENDHETWSSAKIDVKHMLKEKLDLGFEPRIDRDHLVGAMPR